jgi:hypothetical protein
MRRQASRTDRITPSLSLSRVVWVLAGTPSRREAPLQKGGRVSSPLTRGGCPAPDMTDNPKAHGVGHEVKLVNLVPA